jgi:hypothetical protein
MSPEDEREHLGGDPDGDEEPDYTHQREHLLAALPESLGLHCLLIDHRRSRRDLNQFVTRYGKMLLQFRQAISAINCAVCTSLSSDNSSPHNE